MSSELEQLVAEFPGGQRADDETPPVEVVEGSLCSASDLHRAALAGALVSGVLCALAGVGLGYLLGLRDGRDG